MPVSYTHLDVYKRQEYNRAYLPLAERKADEYIGILHPSRLEDVYKRQRYTRWKRFGHAMFCPFYLHEPWVEWMFSQKKTD